MAKAWSLHATHTMSSQLAEALQSQERQSQGMKDIPEEEEDNASEGADSDDDWLVEEEGRLVPGKSTLKISQLSHED
jgi:hypothetical protein